MSTSLFLKAFRCLVAARCCRHMMEAGGAHSLVRRHGESLKEGRAVLPGAEVVIQPAAVCRFARELDRLFMTYSCDIVHNAWRASPFVGFVPVSPVEILRRTLAGDGLFLAASAREQSTPLSSVASRAVYLARPVRSGVRRALDQTGDAGQWPLGFSPACGLWPRMAWLDSVSRLRRLWCLGCGGSWEFPLFRCPFCMDADPSHHRFLESPGNSFCRVDVCENCLRYLKTLTCEPCDAETAYLETELFDVAAEEAGYIRDFIGFVAFDGRPSRASAEYVAKSAFS